MSFYTLIPTSYILWHLFGGRSKYSMVSSCFFFLIPRFWPCYKELKLSEEQFPDKLDSTKFEKICYLIGTKNSQKDTQKDTQ